MFESITDLSLFSLSISFVPLHVPIGSKHLPPTRIASLYAIDAHRNAIEEELEVLYDAYYEELEQYANYQQRYVSSGGTIPPPPGPGPFPGSVELDKNGAVIGHNAPRAAPTAKGRQQQQQQPQARGGKQQPTVQPQVVNGRKPPPGHGYVPPHLQPNAKESEFDEEEDAGEEEYEEEEEEEYDDEEEEEDDEEEEEGDEEEEDVDEQRRQAAAGNKGRGNPKAPARRGGVPILPPPPIQPKGAGRRGVNGVGTDGKDEKDGLFNIGSSLTVSGGFSFRSCLFFFCLPPVLRVGPFHVLQLSSHEWGYFYHAEERVDEFHVINQ
jgi:hypothetical protein